MDLNTVWFILITVLFVGFFFLEGFDYGVGMLMPWLGEDDRERRMVINTIGPVWDGNEVWMITAGGALFAAFPHWYATLFSGFYVPLVLMLLALIARGVAFEFRSKMDAPAWRGTWDRAIFVGSAVPALLWGVALANWIRGLRIDQDMELVGSFVELLNAYALLGGVASLTLFLFHGALFLSLKLGSGLEDRAAAAANRIWPIALTAVVALVGWSLSFAEAGSLGVVPGALAAISVAALATSGLLARGSRHGRAFIASGLSVALLTVAVFTTLFPRVMVSHLDPSYSLTIYSAASSAYTLKLMTYVALALVPVVLVYQSWTYWVFRHRITRESELEY